MSWQLTDGTSQPRRLVDALLEAPAVGEDSTSPSVSTSHRWLPVSWSIWWANSCSTTL